MAVIMPWLDDDFLINILQLEEGASGRNGKVSLLRYVSKSIVNDYVKYMNTVMSVKVEYKIDCCDDVLIRSLIVKAPVTDNKCIFVNTELQMYNDFIPKLFKTALLDIAPKSYKCLRNNCLVTEDLKEDGYFMCDSESLLDYKQVKAALVALAKFHAASVAIKQNDPGCMERNGNETCYSHDLRYAERMKPSTLMRLYGLASVLKSIDNCKRYGDVLIDAGEELWDLMVEVFRPNSKLNVLNHGDFGKNNILFKYDSAGSISNVKFIDYQVRRYCSPAIDLLCLFWTSADFGARIRMYELLELYRNTLNSSLAELGCSGRLSRHELKEEVSKRSPIILLLCIHLPDIFPEPNITLNTNQYSEKNCTSFDFDVNPLLAPFKGKRYRPALLEMCKELENMKIFQILMKNKK